MTALLRDVRTVFVRESLPTWRAPWGLVFGMVQPLVFLVLFGPLLAGSSGFGAASDGSTWQWFVPSVLLMLALFGTTGSGYMLLTEIQGGAHERMLVTPVDRTAMLVGRTSKDVQELLAQAVVVVVATIPVGFELHLGGALLGTALLAVVGVGIGSLSHALAIACRRHQELFYMVQSSVLFPLLFLSGMMLPLDDGPAWMRAVGRVNPLTHVVDALRALFAGDVGGAEVARGWVAAVVLAVLGLALGTSAMRRSAS